MRVAAAILLLALTGCATVQPGGDADRWAVVMEARDDRIYNGIGIRF